MIIPSCREVSKLLSQAQDRPLNAAEKVRLYLHLALCKGCRQVQRHFDFIRAAVKRLSERDENPS